MSALLKFPRPEPQIEIEKPMFSDKFDNGYIMSSRLYRKEVMPFLSDAARNVYAELENRINGYQKETDFVSYSQLQGDSELIGSRTLGRATVSNGLKELISLGVISIIGIGKQGTKSYKIHEISLKDRFSNETSSDAKLVQLRNQTSSVSEPKLVQLVNSQYIYKENIREEHAQENSKENLAEKVLKIWIPDLHDLNSWLQRSGLPKINQAQAEEILLEVNPCYEKRIRDGLLSDSQMYSNFVKWVKRDFKLTEKLFKQAEKNNIQNFTDNPSLFTEDKGDW